MRTNAFCPHFCSTGSTGIRIFVRLPQTVDAPYRVGYQADIGSIYPDIGEEYIQENTVRSQSHQIEKRDFQFRLMEKIIEHGYPHQQNQSHTNDEQSQDKGTSNGFSVGS